MSDANTTTSPNPYLEDMDYGFGVLDTMLRHEANTGIFDREERDQMQRFLNTVATVYGAAIRGAADQEKVQSILADLDAVPDSEVGDDLELALLRDLADALRGSDDPTRRA